MLLMCCNLQADLDQEQVRATQIFAVRAVSPGLTRLQAKRNLQTFFLNLEFLFRKRQSAGRKSSSQIWD